MKTIHIVWAVALTITPLVGASGCATRMVGERFDDARITGRVNRRLLMDPDVERFRIDVDTIARVVTLRGEVDSTAMKTSAERIASDTRGVRRVENQLVIDTRDDDDDGDLGTRMRLGLRLMRAPDVDRRNIDVDVQDGVVTLSGVVHDEKAKALAEKTARETKGVAEVRNELTVNPDDQPLRRETTDSPTDEAPPSEASPDESESDEPMADEPSTGVP
jgi:osmotically-inducible protein OsmY